MVGWCHFSHDMAGLLAKQRVDMIVSLRYLLLCCNCCCCFLFFIFILGFYILDKRL